jgi:hypothetical protein
MERKQHPLSAPMFGAMLGLALVLCLPASGWSASFSLTSDSIFRVFERNNDTVAPAYEYLQADAGSLEEKGLSFHVFGWGRADLADSGFYTDETAGELLYGYLEYANALNNFDVKVGRQYIFEGVSNQSVDGVRVAVDVTPYFTVMAYGGQPVALDSEQGRSGDSTFGGRIGGHLGSRYNLGVSYEVVNNNSTEQVQKLGVDVNAVLPLGATLSGFSSYNLRTDGWGEHSYELRFSVADFDFRPFFAHFDYEDYFGTGVDSANPFIILAGTDQSLTSYGTDILWRKYEKWDIGAKFKGYSYDKGDTDAAYYYAGLLTWHGQGLTQVGGELGYLDGDQSRDRYLLTRAYFYCDQLGKVLPVKFVTGDIVYAYYDQAIYNENSALFLSLGVGENFLKDKLQIKLSGDYSSDPYFDSDLRGLLSARYTFDM